MRKRDIRKGICVLRRKDVHVQVWQRGGLAFRGRHLDGFADEIHVVLLPSAQDDRIDVVSYASIVKFHG